MATIYSLQKNTKGAKDLNYFFVPFAFFCGKIQWVITLDIAHQGDRDCRWLSSPERSGGRIETTALT